MTSADIDDLSLVLADPDVLWVYPHPYTRDEARGWIEWNVGLYRELGFGLWYLTLRDTGEFVGECGLTPQQVEGATEIEVGYHVRPKFWASPRRPRAPVVRSRGRSPGSIASWRSSIRG